MSGQPQTPSKSAPATGGMPVRYCKKCGYALCGLQSPRCPECGREFDLGDPRSTRSRPPRSWMWYVRRAGFVLLAIILVLAATWLWFYWDWRTEKQALAELRPEGRVQGPRLPSWLDFEYHDNAEWLRGHLAEGGFVLDRTTELVIRGPQHDLATIAHLKRLQALGLYDTGVSDLTPLAGLTDMRRLWIDGGDISDLSKISGMTSLMDLYLFHLPGLTDFSALSKLKTLARLGLNHASISDLTPLAGLTELQILDLQGTNVTDLRPLAGEGMILQQLDIRHTPVRDLSPLSPLKTLRWLRVDQDVSAEQIAALKRVLRACDIIRE